MAAGALPAGPDPVRPPPVRDPAGDAGGPHLIAYLDSSALLKEFVPEEGSAEVRRLLRRGDAATSLLTFVEIASALHRRARLRQIPRKDLGRALDALAAGAEELLVVDFSPEVAAEAQALLADHPLRASDAVQLASCAHLSGRIGGGVTFVAWDADLLRAARALGLPTAGA